MLQNTVAPTLFLATEHKLRAVRKASLQEFSGPPPLPETQAGHHPPVLKETEHRKKAKIEYFQTFCIMSCPSLRKVYLRNALECCRPQTSFLQLICFFSLSQTNPNQQNYVGEGRNAYNFLFKNPRYSTIL